jgi:hypothetical protein
VLGTGVANHLAVTGTGAFAHPFAATVIDWAHINSGSRNLAGLETMRAAYAHAIASGYRFYSYGDTSLIGRAP